MDEVLNVLVERIADAVSARLQPQMEAAQAANKPRFLSRYEAAEFLKISLPTLHKLVNMNKLHPLKIGGRRLFSETDLVAAMESGLTRKYQRFS